MYRATIPSPRSRTRHPFIEQLDPVPHRRFGAALKVRDAADVRRCDHDGIPGLQRRELVALQPAGGSGCRIEYVPAEPQQRWPSATGVSV